jgi:hypothetical protein
MAARIAASVLAPQLEHAPQTVLVSIKSANEELVSGVIDLEAEYQREVVWTDRHQVEFMDSLMHNFYVPPLILVVRTENGRRIKRCIDGKQRLTAVRRFFQGRVPLYIDDTAYYYSWNVPMANKGGVVLAGNDQFDISNRALTFVTYAEDHLSPELERELFARVQKGVALSSGELLNMRGDQAARFIQALSAASAEILQKFVRGSKRKEILLLATRLAAMASGHLAFTGTYRGLEDKVRPDEETRRRFGELVALLDAWSTSACRRSMIAGCTLARCLLEQPGDPGAARERAIKIIEWGAANGTRSWPATEKMLRATPIDHGRLAAPGLADPAGPPAQ